MILICGESLERLDRLPISPQTGACSSLPSRKSVMRRVVTVVVWLLVPVAAGAEEPHWAWSPVTRPAVPPIVHGTSVNPIDRFIRARLPSAGLTPAPRARLEHLIRRMTFDLTGLPPTPDETDSLLRDPSPDAWDRVVDRLLASPRYGDAGAGTGSTWSVTPTRTASNSTSPGPTRGGIAITSFEVSTTTRRTTGSSPSNSPATKRTRAIRPRKSRPASTCSAPT